MRTVLKLLSGYYLLRAVFRGPRYLAAFLLRRTIRRQVNRQLNRRLRKIR